MTSESAAEFVERIKREWDGDNVPCVEDFDQLIALARRGAAMQTLGAHEFDPDPFFPTHCKCGRRFENNVHDLPPPPAGETNE